MSKKRLRMGKLGIHAMLGAKRKSENNNSDLRIDKVAINQLQSGQYQPRQQFEEVALKELSESIRIQGVVQPIIVRLVGTDRYEIIAGERRWRAAKLAELNKVPVVIRQADDQETLAMALIENIQREDLNPIETAIGLKRLLKEFGLTQQAIADTIGRSRAAVSNLLRLLKLPKSIQKALNNNMISMGHARAIISLPENIQKLLVDKAIRAGWSVREMEEAVHQVLLPKKIVKFSQKNKVTENKKIQQYQQVLADKVATKVRINQQQNGCGKIEILYKDLEELERLLKLF